MNLGFVSAIFSELSLEHVMTFAADVGYDCVEVMSWPPGRADRRYAGVTHVDVTDFDETRAEEVHRLVAKTGIQISGLGYYPNPLAPDREEAATAVAHLRNTIRASALLGVKQVNTFIGRDWTKSVDENWARMLETWRPLVSYAAEHDVRIGIENCPMLFTDDEWPGGKNLATSPVIWRRLFADLDSPHIGLNYDPSHLIWQHMDEVRPIREFAGRLFHVHAKDVRIDREALNDHGILATPKQFHTAKIPGLGDVDWRGFFSALTDAQFHGPVCVEVEDRAYEGTLENRQAALRQSHTYLRQFVPGRGSVSPG